MGTNGRNAKGEGSFRKNSNGTFTHRKSVGYKADGGRKVLTVTAPTKTACIREMRKKEAEWNHLKNASHIQLKDTVAELCYRHLEYQMENGDLRPKSVDRRESTIKNQIEKYDFGKMQLHMVTPIEVDKHIRYLMKEGKLSESSITKTVDVLNAAYTWATLHGDQRTNPVQSVKPDLVKKLKKMSAKHANEADVVVLSEDEIHRFTLEAMKKNAKGTMKYPAGLYMLLLLHTGMRCGELCISKWSCVDWQNGLFTIEKSASMAKNREKETEEDNNFVMMEGETKNQKARIIQLTKEARQILAMLYERDQPHGENDLIAPTLNGKMNTASNLEHRMKVIMKNAGLGDIEGGLHIFRRTFATRMYEQGARVEEIAAYIGNLESTTRKYYIAIRKKHVTDKGIKQVVNLPNMTAKSARTFNSDSPEDTR